MRHGGKILIDQLEIQGATTTFTVPGESFLAALDGLHDSNRIKTIICRQEGGASMMAEAWGKITGEPGICFVTRGPGAANAMSGLHVARQDSTPMVAFVGMPSSGHEDREAFQEIEIKQVFSSFVKWAAVIRQTERIHGIVTHGGDAPNIVPKLTTAAYFVRAANSEELQVLKERVVRCFEAGALATGCELEVSWLVKDYEFVRMNPTIGEVYEANLEKTGRSALPRQVIGNQAASTDMGNVSHVVPSIHPMMSIDSLPAVNHQAEFAAASISPAGDRAVVDAALVLASTVVDIATTPGAVDRLREEFAHPIPDSSLRL